MMAPPRHSEVLTVIPARLASVRLPEKLIANIHGRPVIYWLAHRIREFSFSDFVVATDSSVIAGLCEKYSIPYMMTSSTCANGTERVHEVASESPGYTHFLNVQGDEPLIRFDVIDRLIKTVGSNDHAFKAAVAAIEQGENNPSEAKVAMQEDNKIRYVSRSQVPYGRDQRVALYKLHGAFLYSRHVLRNFINAPVGALEEAEKLEQLRCIENDIDLYGVVCPDSPRSIDTAEDLDFYRSVPKRFFENPVEFSAVGEMGNVFPQNL